MRRCAALALAPLALLLLGLPAGARHARSAAVPSVSVAGDVRAAVQAGGQARIIIELNEPAPSPAEVRGAARGALRARMRAAHARVLADVPAFAPTHAYDALPAMAGAVDAATLARLEHSPHVRSIVLDRQGSGALDQSVAMINADDVHNTLGYTGAGVTVAVLDTGVDRDHPDLQDAIAYEECWLLDSSCPGGGTHTSGPGSGEGDHFHGSNVSGIITSNGIVAPLGVAPDAQIAVYKILNSANAGWISDWIAALNDILANHPEVDAVNMSLTDNTNRGASCNATYPPATTAIDALRAAGVITYVASGNNAFTTGMSFPACVDSAISVGAVSDATAGGPVTVLACTWVPTFDVPTCFSNSVATLDVLAPGYVIESAGLNGGVSFAAGTSMAAPHAAGLGALMLEANASLTPATIEAALESTGVPRLDPKNGVTTPRIDAWAALVEVTDPDNDGLPTILDNCPAVANADQANTDRNYIDHSPPFSPSADDKTRPNSDTAGDACDADDDNDARADADEATGAGCAGRTSNPLNPDTDGDRALDGAECSLGFDPSSSLSAPSITNCGATGVDTDGDRLSDRVEYCYYATNPANTDSDGDRFVDGGRDGCEAMSFNGDRIVNVADSAMLAQAGAGGLATYHPNVDIDKNGILNIADRGLIASINNPPGQCP